MTDQHWMNVSNDAGSPQLTYFKANLSTNSGYTPEGKPQNSAQPLSSTHSGN